MMTGSKHEWLARSLRLPSAKRRTGTAAARLRSGKGSGWRITQAMAAGGDNLLDIGAVTPFADNAPHSAGRAYYLLESILTITTFKLIERHRYFLFWLEFA